MLQNTDTNLHKIIHAVVNPEADTEDDMCADLRKITHATFLEAVDDIMQGTGNRIASLEMILVYANRYFALCDEYGVQYGKQAHDSLFAYVHSKIEKIEKEADKHAV